MNEVRGATLARNMLRSGRWWFLLLVTLCVSGLTFRLGNWQLGRAEQKEAIYAQQQAQMLAHMDLAMQRGGG